MTTKITLEQVMEHLEKENYTQKITEMYDFAMEKICKLSHPRLRIITDEPKYDGCGWYLFPCFIYFSVRNTINASLSNCKDDATLDGITKGFYESSLLVMIHEACHATQYLDIIETYYSYGIGDPSYNNIVEADNDARTIHALYDNEIEILEKFGINVWEYNFHNSREGFLVLKSMTYNTFITAIVETFTAHHFKSLDAYNQARHLSNQIQTALKDPYSVLLFNINGEEFIIKGGASIDDRALPDDVIDWLIEHKFYTMDRTINRIDLTCDNKNDLFNVICLEIEFEIKE